MCYEYDDLQWLQRAEEFRRKMELAEKLKRQPAEAPEKPAAPDKGKGQEEPVPA